MAIYIAASTKNAIIARECAKILAEYPPKFEVTFPWWDHLGEGQSEWPKLVKKCLNGVREATTVLGIYEQGAGSPGLFHELGFARALGRQTALVYAYGCESKMPEEFFFCDDYWQMRTSSAFYLTGDFDGYFIWEKANTKKRAANICRAFLDMLPSLPTGPCNLFSGRPPVDAQVVPLSATDPESVTL